MRKRNDNGQSMVEFVLVLPLLLLLLIGLVETGYAMYDYMILVNSSREGVRLASRGRFEDSEIVNWVVSSGGKYKDLDILRLTAAGPEENQEANYGIIITRVPIPEDIPANPSAAWWQDLADDVQYHTAGVISKNGSYQNISLADSRIGGALLDEMRNNVGVSDMVNAARTDSGYEAKQNYIVIVESFLSHRMILDMPEFVPFIEDPNVLYSKSTMRISIDARVE